MPAGKQAFQFLTVNEVDGVAVITFLETAAMVEGDKVESLSKELFSLIDEEEVQEGLAQPVQRRLHVQRNAGTTGDAAPQDAGPEGESTPLLPATARDGRVQGQPV